MFSIFKKDFNSFFTSPIAYLVIGVYLLICGLFLWFFKGDYNILNAGFSDMNSFFYLSPWLFLFLIPAITMKSFSDEFNNGTIEILKTKPISINQIILGKFTSSLVLVLLAILPTLLYVYSIYQLGNPVGNIDFGNTIGSYLGLFLLITSYVSVGLFTSTLSNSQINSFILGVLIIFVLYYGLDALGDLSNSLNIKQLGINEHFKSISRGVIDTRDLIYFMSITLFFLYITKLQLNNE